jgi:EpsG family
VLSSIYQFNRLLAFANWLACIVLMAWLAMLSVDNNLQSDYRIYEAAYNGMVLFKFETCEGMELGWCLPAMLMSHYEMPYADVAFFFSFLIYGLTFGFLVRSAFIAGVTNYYAGVGLLIFGFAFLRPEMASHLTRQYLAAMFLLLAILELKSKGRLVWVWFVFAVMFHISALVMFPVFVCIRNFEFELKKLLGVMGVLTGLLFLAKLEFFRGFVDWGLAVNIEPRILYNILYKIKYIAQQDDVLPFWKGAVLGFGVFVAIPFLKMVRVKAFFYCYAYFLWLMAVTHHFSTIYFVRLFHYEKIILFGMVVMIAFELLSTHSNRAEYEWKPQK